MVLFGVVLAAVMLQARATGDGSMDLEQMLPIWKVEQDCILSKNGDVTLVFQCELPEIFCLSEEEYDALHHTWLKAIKVLPEGTVLHKQDYFRSALHDINGGSVEEEVPKSGKDRFFDGRPYLDHDCLLMLTLSPSGRKMASSAWSNLLRKHIVPPDSLDVALLHRTMEIAAQFVRILSDGGTVKLAQLKEAEITGSRHRTGLLERYLMQLGKKDRPELRDIEFKPEWKIGANYNLLFNLSDTEDLPTSCAPARNYDRYATDRTKFSIGFATAIGQLLDVDHIFNQFIIVGDPTGTFKRMEAKARRLHSLSAYSRENALARDATEEYLNEAISESRTPIRAHFNVQCWTDDHSRLRELRSQVSAALARMDIVPRLETKGAAQLWWAGLPGNAADLPENDTFETFAEQATCFLNMETNYRSSKSSFGIRLSDRLSGIPLHVDISDEPMKLGLAQNRNKIVVGGSGSGKSMFMNHMLHSYVLQGSHCIVVDVGHSYEGLCKLLNGYYFTYTEEQPIRFNPFYVEVGDHMDTERRESLKTLLLSLWKHEEEMIRRSEYVAISNALVGYFAHLEKHQGMFPCFDSFYDYIRDEFARKVAADGVKERDFDLNNFLYVLRPYYGDGEFGFLLNAKENLDILRQPFVVFELDNIKSHPILFGVVTLLVADLFISKMRKLKGIRKVIVIEEAWKAIAKAGMAEFIKYLYKTVRKHFGEAITVTQEVDDLISSEIIKEAIINSTDCKILLDLRKFQNKFEKIQAALGMVDKGRDMVLSLNRANDARYRYKEVYIEIGNTWMKVFRNEPTPEEYYAYTTEQSEKMEVERYTAMYGGDIRKGIAALVRDKQE